MQSTLQGFRPGGGYFSYILLNAIDILTTCKVIIKGLVLSFFFSLCFRLRIYGCSDCHLHFAISVPKDKYDMREKQTAMILFFQLLNYLKIFTLGKSCNYLLTTMQGDHFANYENIVSQSQTLSLSPLVQAPRCSNIG